jgi:hypothetical protein
VQPRAKEITGVTQQAQAIIWSAGHPYREHPTTNIQRSISNWELNVGCSSHN